MKWFIFLNWLKLRVTESFIQMIQTVLFLAALLVLVLVFWMKMLLSFSHILVTYKLKSFSQVLVNENKNVLVNF